MIHVNDSDKKVYDGEGISEQRALLKLVSSATSFPSGWMSEAAVLILNKVPETASEAKQVRLCKA